MLSIGVWLLCAGQSGAQSTAAATTQEAPGIGADEAFLLDDAPLNEEAAQKEEPPLAKKEAAATGTAGEKDNKELAEKPAAGQTESTSGVSEATEAPFLDDHAAEATAAAQDAEREAATLSVTAGAANAEAVSSSLGISDATGDNSLLDALESDSPISDAADGAAADVTAEVESLFSNDITKNEVYREERLMDMDISRLQFSLNDLQNGILIKRLPKGTAGSPSLSGFTGIYRTITAEKRARNSFRFGSHMSFYYLGDLWDGASQSHLDAVGFFSYSILDELEVRIGANASGHHSGIQGQFREEPLFQILGDVQLGGKYSYEFYPWLSAAGVWDLKFYTNVGRFGIRWDAFSTLWLVAGSIDWREFPYYKLPFPLRTHINIGYFLDQSAALGADIDEISASSYFGLGLSPGDKLMMRFALEYPEDPIAYFVEYSTEQIVNSRDAAVRINKWTQSPGRFTFGVRYNPYENILIDGAIDLSYGLQQAVKIYGKLQPPGNPYALNFGFSYEWNPRGWAVFDLRGRLRGIVVDADTGEPVGGAIVEYVDRKGDSYQAADTDTGEFVSYRLPPGRVTIQVRKENYEPTLIEPEVSPRQIQEEKIFLRRIRKEGEQEIVGVLVGQILDGSNHPLTATIEFVDNDINDVSSNPEDGSFLKILPPGNYQIRVTAPGFEAKSYEVPIEANKKTRVLFQLVTGDEVGAVAGTVLDDQDQPLSAEITFLDAQIETISADATGKFFRVLPAGIYQIQIRLLGYSTRLLEVPVEAGKKTTLDIRLVPEKSEGAMAGIVRSNLERPLPAVLTFADPAITPVPTDPETGSYFKVLSPGNYDVTVQAPGYESKSFRIPVLKNKKTVQDFVLRGLQELGKRLARLEGDRIVLENPIVFEPGSTLLTERSYLVLNDVAKILLANNGLKIQIAAHTNNLGPSKANLALSQSRATVIREYLVSIGVAASALEPRGFGEEKPMVSNDTPEGREKNERIEFPVLKKGRSRR